jgi:ribonucleoside-diphosphate reductase alpha chain
VDTAISKTVNIPEDFVYEDFKGLYQQAWDAGLKGVATYRPNSILGAVLQAGPKPVDASSKATVVQANPMRTVIESRPKGALPAVAEKIDYWTSEGPKTLYLLVSFMQVPCADGYQKVDRAIEFFMPVGQSGESQQWVTSSMRLLSLAARGGFLERALSDMRKVIWDRGPVRLGTYLKADGNQVPMWHDSEVAAIAYAIQKIIESRNQIKENPNATSDDPLLHQPTTHEMAGKKCQECGAHAVIKKDGCEFCTQCGNIGACG